MALGQTDLNGGFPLAEEQLPRIGDMVSAKVAPSGALVGPSNAGLWAQVALPHSLASLVHVCHHFG